MAIVSNSVRKSRKVAARRIAASWPDPLFAVVVIDRDGNESLRLPCVSALDAAKYIGGFNASAAHTGSYAEARELDRLAFRFTGKQLTAKHIRERLARKAVDA